MNTQEEIKRKLLLGGEYLPDDNVIARTTPAWLVALSLMVLGVAYSIVNHTQSMRMFAAKSEWDLKMCVFVAGMVMIVMSFFNLSMGVLGRALVPDQAALPNGNQDQIYPYLIAQLGTVGLTGIVVAGIFAASFSTYDSIGSSLAALLTRDVYARLFVRDRDDHHYLRVGQILTPIVIGLSFFYVPSLLKGGMLLQFLDWTSAFVIPLLTIFLMGRFTRAHRVSGTIGLLVGAAYGMLRLIAHTIALKWGIAILPSFMTNSWAAYPLSMVVTGATMLLVSLVKGWQPREDTIENWHEERGAWLKSSQQAVQALAKEEAKSAVTAGSLPAALAILAIVLGCFICFVVLW